MKAKNADFISAFVSGMTPFSTDILGVPDITVSVVHNDIGRYMPYAWYSEYNPLRSAVILTDVVASEAEEHYDDIVHYGYGYFFLHDQGKDTFQKPSVHLNGVMGLLADAHAEQAAAEQAAANAGNS